MEKNEHYAYIAINKLVEFGNNLGMQQKLKMRLENFCFNPNHKHEFQHISTSKLFLMTSDNEKTLFP
jgi:hypothetical protein